MSPAQSDRNLLFGILALQMDFIGRDQLVAAMNAWVLDKAKPLDAILVEQKALAPNRQALLEALVLEHLKQHDNDPQQSLAAVSSAGSIRNELERIADADLQMSLGHVGSAAGQDQFPTRTASVGTPTSSGMRFRILRPHARGGLGEVFVAHDEELHREVALKEIQDRHADHIESRARFVLEAEITGGLEHPGIVPVYGLGQYADGRPFYAMRFIRGDSLRDAIEHFHRSKTSEISKTSDVSATGERTVEFRKLLGRFIDVCNAIAYAHSRGVLHRDLKPGNIMLGKYGETLVVDWGLAKPSGEPEPGEPGTSAPGQEAPLRPSSSSGSAQTQAGTAMGTPQFMSPEQAAGRLDLLGPASDVYSLGATLYCILTGKAPFAEQDVGSTLQKVQRGDFPRPSQVQSGVPAPLEAVCLKAMALRPADRYSSPRALADDIEHWLADEPVSAWPEPVAIRAGRWMRRHKALVSGAAAAVLVGVFALTGGLIWYQGHQAEAARKLALTEQSVRQSLEQAQKTHDELIVSLKKPGGVQEHLNQPARWQAQITTARGDWQRAKDLAAPVQAEIEPELTGFMEQVEQKLERAQADYRLALRLEKIRLDRATVIVGDKLNYAHTLRDYPETFRQAGLAFEPGRAKELAGLIQQSAIKDQLLAALDDWAWVEIVKKNLALTGKLLEVSRLADPDPWRDKLRNPAVWTNREALLNLVEDIEKHQSIFASLSPQMLELIAHLLPRGKQEEMWLRRAQALHPADYLLNKSLGDFLRSTKQPLEAAGFYRAALAIRPNTPVVYINLSVALDDHKDLPAALEAIKKALAIDPKPAMAWITLGDVLRHKKDLPAALDAYKKAIACEPNFAFAWSKLGYALEYNNDFPAAIDAYKKALAIDANDADAWFNLGNSHYNQKDLPAAIDANKKALAIDGKFAKAWHNLGNALDDLNELPAAIDAYKKALAIDPNMAMSWNNLAVSLNKQKNWSAGIEACKKALAIDPKFDKPWFHLGHAYMEQGDFSAATKSLQTAHELGFPSSSEIRQCEKLLVLEKRLPLVLKGEAANALELVGLADLCVRYKKRYSDAMELYGRAFAAKQPGSNDLELGHRYEGARVASLAAVGKETGSEKLEEKDKARLRRKALEWLKADLAAGLHLLGQDPIRVNNNLQNWQSDPDLAGVREAKELARLPKDERDSWTKFWSEVAALRQKARASYTETEHQSQLGPKEREKTHHLKMVAGKSYVIDMASPRFDTYLRLEDDKGNILAENDDISKDNQNSRIIFTAPKDGSYHIVATSFQQRGVGAYTLTIREFTAKKKQ